MGIFTTCKIRLCSIPAYCLNKKLKRAVDSCFTDAVSFTLNDNFHHEKGDTTKIALIYKMGERDNAEIGNVLYHHDSKELAIDTRPIYTLSDIDDNHYDIFPWVKCINLTTGMIVELVNMKQDIADEIYQRYVKRNF